jgi:hypothetical protein
MGPLRTFGTPIRPFKSQHVQIEANQLVTVFGWSAGFIDWKPVRRSPDGADLDDQSERYVSMVEKAMYICAVEADGAPVVAQLSPFAMVQVWLQALPLLHLRGLRHHTVTTIKAPLGDLPVVRTKPSRTSVSVEWKDMPGDFGAGWTRLNLAAVDISPAFYGVSFVPAAT